MLRSQPSPAHRAFTLVELLVVIGIIAVLIAILLPVLRSARDHANRVKCMANMKQLLYATTMYCNENKGMLPWSTWDNVGNCVGWLYAKPRTNGNNFVPYDVETGSYWPYLKTAEVFKCPAGRSFSDITKSYNITHYLMNGAINGFGRLQPSGQPVYYKITQFRSDDVVFLELSDSARSGDGTMQPVWANDASSFPGEDFSNRHIIGMCIGSIDSHCEWIDWKSWKAEVDKPGRNRAYCTPPPDSSDGR